MNLNKTENPTIAHLFLEDTALSLARRPEVKFVIKNNNIATMKYQPKHLNCPLDENDGAKEVRHEHQEHESDQIKNDIAFFKQVNSKRLTISNLSFSGRDYFSPMAIMLPYIRTASSMQCRP